VTGPEPERERPVVLVGLMGVGKSAVGRRLAERLGRPFVDTDARVAELAGSSIAELFEHEGEDAFRARESSALVEALAGRPPAVVATGGGVVLAEHNRRLLTQQATVVWLDAPPDVLAERVGAGRERPLLAGADPLVRLRRLDAARRHHYEAVAHLVVDATAPVDEVVAAVAAALGAGVVADPVGRAR
jgi:shikimate kinase